MHADTDGGRLRPDSEFIDVAAEVFRLLADATRIRIVLALQGGAELPVNELAEIVDRAPAAVSQHLAKLRWARVVRVRQAGNRMFYRLSDEHAMRLVAEAVMQAEHAVEEVPGHHR
ncbi:MAG TPA: metalloregulator ArsR/SmtB family transcription factor [Microbacterium sp.]|nr:metalloregulator ArsR/SmtB family transcription factor [Microbacterium sp.]